MSSFGDILELIVQRHASKLDYDFPESHSSLLKTNNLPSESDAKVLEDLSKRVSDALRLVTSDMESVIGVYSQLKQIQDHLLHVDTDIKIAMSSIERLPVEILALIFKEATSTMGNPLDIRWEPFVISRVCHKWRVVATEQCPEMWTKFILERTRWEYVKKPVVLLSLVLSRGAERSLEFDVDARPGRYVSECESEKYSGEESSDEDDDETYARQPAHLRRDDDVTGPLLQDLVRHCHRWRDVRFFIPSRLFGLLSPIRGKLPALISFYLDCVTRNYGVYSPTLAEPFMLDGAPLLKTVSLSSIKIDLPVLNPEGAPNLTSYTDDRVLIFGDPALSQHFLHIIRTSLHLKSFSIKHRCPEPVPTPRVVNPGITRFSTSDATFLRSLTLPGLKNMELGDRTVSLDIHEEISTLYDLVVHSACNLSSLKLVHCAVNEELIHILEASSDLTTLTLEFSTTEVDDSLRTIKRLFDRLRSSEHVLVPRLQSLSLSLEVDDFISTDYGLFGPSFGHTIEDRWRNGTLRSITVATFPNGGEFTLSPGSRNKLMKLKDEGMNIKFRRSGKLLV
ncbi:hypothetical protein IW262DRAFT_894645 [Armillaria fumosa]|nr:hypothetical protein IW262DRAFT_894645 [Armillaria fumosa]